MGNFVFTDREVAFLNSQLLVDKLLGLACPLLEVLEQKKGCEFANYKKHNWQCACSELAIVQLV